MHLLVLIESVNHFTMHGRNNMKVSECFFTGINQDQHVGCTYIIVDFKYVCVGLCLLMHC